MALEIQRQFNMTDDEMLERAQLFHDILNTELATFTARFPWLDAAWLSAFNNDINAADLYPKDESIILDQKVLTGDVGTSMNRGFSALQELAVYAKLAYANDPARQRVFGQDYWAKARNNTLKLQEALELAYAKADNADYKADLLAKGYTQAEIDALNSMANELQLKNGLQESAKSGRKVNRHDRVVLHNIVWGDMGTVNTTAQVVWKDDADRLEQYQMYPPTGGAADTTVRIEVTGSDTNPLPDVTVTLSDTAFDPLVTDAEGLVTFAGSSIPELLNVRLEHATLGTEDFKNQPIIIGEVNEIGLVMGA